MNTIKQWLNWFAWNFGGLRGDCMFTLEGEEDFESSFVELPDVPSGTPGWDC